MLSPKMSPKLGKSEESGDFLIDNTYNTKRMRRKLLPGTLATAVALILTFVGNRALSADSAGQQNPILDFYVKSAAASFTSRDPIAAGLSFSFRATTYYKDLNRGGKVQLTDSLVADYYYSFGALDSTVALAPSKEKHPAPDIIVPNVFSMNYLFNFFPNDTGGSDLAIGFDTKDTTSADPTGIAIIDRDRFFLKRLYLYYSNSLAYKRYSRSLRYTEFEGFNFPDSIWEVRAEAGIFSSRHYRVETGIGQLQIYR